MILHDSEHCSRRVYGKRICIESVRARYVLLRVFSSVHKHNNSLVQSVLELVSLQGEPTRLITTSGGNYLHLQQHSQ